MWAFLPETNISSDFLGAHIVLRGPATLVRSAGASFKLNMDGRGFGIGFSECSHVGSSVNLSVSSIGDTLSSGGVSLVGSCGMGGGHVVQHHAAVRVLRPMEKLMPLSAQVLLTQTEHSENKVN